MTALVLVTPGTRAANATCLFDAQGSPCSRFWQMQAVLVGEITDKTRIDKGSETSKGTYRLQVAITEAFRGVVGQRSVVIHAQEDECSADLRVGERIFFYAIPRDDGTLWTSSDSKPLDSADEDLAYARLATAKSAPTMVYGDVVQRESAGPDVVSFRKLAGIAVRVWSESFEATTRTDERGDYSVHLPGPGTYRIEATAPAGLATLSARDNRFTVRNAQACWRADIQLVSNGRIRGVVVDGATGRPVPDLVLLASGSWEVTTTDGSGAFDLGPLYAGVYSVSALISSESQNVLAREVGVSEGRTTTVRLIATDFPKALVSMTLDLTGLPEDDILFIPATHQRDRIGFRREFTVALERGASIDVWLESVAGMKKATFTTGKDPTRIRLSDLAWQRARY